MNMNMAVYQVIEPSFFVTFIHYLKMHSPRGNLLWRVSDQQWRNDKLSNSFHRKRNCWTGWLRSPKLLKSLQQWERGKFWFSGFAWLDSNDRRTVA